MEELAEEMQSSCVDGVASELPTALRRLLEVLWAQIEGVGEREGVRISECIVSFRLGEDILDLIDRGLSVWKKEESLDLADNGLRKAATISDGVYSESQKNFLSVAASDTHDDVSV